MPERPWRIESRTQGYAWTRWNNAYASFENAHEAILEMTAGVPMWENHEFRVIDTREDDRG